MNTVFFRRWLLATLVLFAPLASGQELMLPGYADAQRLPEVETPPLQLASWAASENAQNDLAERMEKLEASYQELDEAYSSLKSDLKSYAKSGHSGATMRVNGRIHADMWGFPDTSPGINGFETGNVNNSVQDRVGFRRMRFGVKGDLTYNMEYKIEMEFAGGNDAEFRDVYIGWNELPVFRTLLLGNQKRPYGLDHLNSSRYNVFLERPFIIESFNQDARRFGLASYGVSEDQAWNWRYGVYNARLIQDEGNYISDHWQSEFAARIANTIWWDESSDGRGYAHWAVSGTWVNVDENGGIGGRAAPESRFRHRGEARHRARWLNTGFVPGADDYGLLGGEAVLNVGAVQIVGEYLNVWMDRTGFDDVRFHGGYAYISYFLTGEHMPWSRSSGTLGRIEPIENFFMVNRCRGGKGGGWGAWQVAFRYSYGDLSDEDILGGVGESLTFGLNWYWTKYSRMQFNYIYGEIDENDLNAAAGGPNFGDYQILGARFMVDF